MPVYHSSFNDVENCKTVCNVTVLPLKTRSRGPAPKALDSERDVIDEAIEFFRANVFFKSYEVKGGADRALIYLTIYISQVFIVFFIFLCPSLYKP